jgi:hypothetical protein
MPPLRPYLLRVDYRFGARDDPDARARVAGVVEQALRGIGVRDSETAVKLQHLREGATPRRVVLATD